jgi:hypothetical protein
MDANKIAEVLGCDARDVRIDPSGTVLHCTSETIIKTRSLRCKPGCATGGNSVILPVRFSKIVSQSQHPCP